MNISESTRARISRLREHVLQPPQVCVEKGLYMTESYRETEGLAEHRRRALALCNILSKLTLTIMDDELLVGRVTSKPRGGALSPEINCSWYLDQMDLLSTRPSDRFAPIADWEKEKIREIVAYWDGKSLFHKWNNTVSAESKEKTSLLFSGGAFSGNTQYYGHFTVLYERLLSKGIKGLIADVDASISGQTDPEKKEYLESMKIALGSAVILANRYADLAEEMAQSASDERREELLEIARICRKVPENPAESFREALQSMWLAYIAVVIESWGASPCLDRIDQYLYPYYKADITSGKITEEEVFLLISMFFIKCNEQLTIYHTEATRTFGGMTSRIAVNLGGLTPEGETAVNELSYLFLEAEKVIACGEDMVIQVGYRTPDEFLFKAVELAKAIHGKIKFVGEDVIHRNLVSEHGMTDTQANNLVVTGCNTMGVPGLTMEQPGGILNLPLLLDLAMNDGYSPYLGLQLGPHTGKAEDFTCYEQLLDAFKAQYDYFIPHVEHLKDTDKSLFGKYAQAPFQSALYDVCIEKGMDCMSGGAPFMGFGISLAGIPNVADSLAVVKKLVFENKKLTMEQLLNACRDNFTGHEDILHMIGAVPKFGNDIDYVDDIANEIICYCSDKAAEYRGYCGARSTVAAATITANIPHGKNVGAQPDGRLAGTPISEGGISPHQGRNVSGITATLRSVGKLNHQKLGNGSVLNMRIDPEILKGDAELMKLAQLIRGFHMMGGYLVQFNIVSTDTLRAAQADPGQYKDLIVRVATYSAYFVELSRELQDDIISRLEMKTM